MQDVTSGSPLASMLETMWLRFMGDARVLAMKDYQRFWLLSLLMASSKSPLPNELGQLFNLSHCTASRKFFEKEFPCVRELFEVSSDGRFLLQKEGLWKRPDLDEPPSRFGQYTNSRNSVCDFETFWEKYPRKVRKDYARKCYHQVLKYLAAQRQVTFTDRGGQPQTVGISSEAEAAEFLQKAVAEFAATPLGSRSDKEFIPHASSWLNSGSYSDDRREWSYANGNGNREPLRQTCNIQPHQAVLQPGTRAGAFSDPDFGKNEQLEVWLAGLEKARSSKQARPARDPVRRDYAAGPAAG